MGLDNRKGRIGVVRGRGTADKRDGVRRPRLSVLVALLLACAVLIALDYRGGQSSPVEPARRVMGEALGPVESATASGVRPFAGLSELFRSRDSLRDEVDRLEQENADLRGKVAASGFDRSRLEQLEGLTRAAKAWGYALAPARVIALGPSQSFKRTVTIDAGTDAGVRPDQTVLCSDGLVGRVIRATRTTATVLLILDAESVVGGRIGDSRELGFLRGRGEVGETARLDLELVDDAITPNEGDAVVSWGSEGGAPYVQRIPIGRIATVYSSPRETAKRAVIEPYVDFSALDVVGVVVPHDTESDRSLVRADGALR